MRGYFSVYGKTPHTEIDVQWWQMSYRERWEMFKGSLFLDIGFGSGYFMRTAPTSAWVVGVEIDEEALRVFRRSLPHIPVVRATGTALPFHEEIFDGVHCSHVIEHLWEPEFLIEEIRRVLKPGGKVMIRTPDIRRSQFQFYVDHTHRHPFTEQSLRKILTVYGFGEFYLEHGLFRTTRIELWAQRLFKIPVTILYPIKKWLGRCYSKELVCIARKLG